MSEKNVTHSDELGFVRGPEDIPSGLSDEEQLEFWETHEITEEFLAKTEELPAEERPRPRRRDRHATVRLGKETAEDLSALADARGVPFQVLARELLQEGIRREWRDQEKQGPEKEDTPDTTRAEPNALATGFDASRYMAGMSESDASRGKIGLGGGSFGLQPWSEMAAGFSNPPPFGVVGALQGLGPLHGLKHGLSGAGSIINRLPTVVSPPGQLRALRTQDAIHTTQEIVRRGMLDSRAGAAALGFGTGETLRRLISQKGTAGQAGFHVRLAREAISGRLGAYGVRIVVQDKDEGPGQDNDQAGDAGLLARDA